MSIRSRYGAGGQFEFYDDVSQERVQPIRAVLFYEDFLGAGWVGTIPTAKTIGIDWIKKLVQSAGTPTVAGVANGANGQIALALDATSEKQEATLYFGDQKTFNSLAGVAFEARAQMGVIPTLLAEGIIGVHSAWIDGPDNAAEYAHFNINAGGAIYCESYDGTSTESVASGITIATTTEWHDFLIDFSALGVIKFLIDGNQVAETTTFPWAASGAGAVLQPYFSVYKGSGAGVATANVDFARLWQNR